MSPVNSSLIPRHASTNIRSHAGNQVSHLTASLQTLVGGKKEVVWDFEWEFFGICRFDSRIVNVEEILFVESFENFVFQLICRDVSSSAEFEEFYRD